MTTAEIRAARADELEPVRALLVDARLPLDGFDDAAVVLVAVDGSAVVGAIALERHGEPPAMLLRSAVVAPALRGSGLGEALVRSALAVADDAGAPVALLTETAAGWFPRFGFVEMPWSQLPEPLSASRELQGACSASATAMLRPAPSPAST
jgi:amino-acid N-acetyltransferase